MSWSASWQDSKIMQPPSSSSIPSPCGGINLSFFIPMQPLIFIFGLNAFEITAHSVTLGWNQLLDSTVIGRGGQKGGGMHKEHDRTYLSNSSLGGFFQLQVFGINMQRLCPTRMSSFRYEITLQISLFHFFLSHTKLSIWMTLVYFFSFFSSHCTIFCISCCIPE